jgi:hypothetical protein
MGVWEGKRGMITEEMGYRSFLLRVWYFTSLETLHEFLSNLGEVLESEMEEKNR